MCINVLYMYRLTRRVGSDGLLVAWSTPEDNDVVGFQVNDNYNNNIFILHVAEEWNTTKHCVLLNKLLSVQQFYITCIYIYIYIYIYM